MCGRYASSRQPDELIEEFDASPHFAEALAPSWNVAPTDEVYAVVERPPRGEDEQPAERQLRVVRWGLVPSWAKERSIGSRMINARLETLAEKPAFRRALAARRCLVPADGYYEWYPTAELTAAGKPKKQPFHIRPADGGVLAMAGLYELWRDPALADDDPARWLWSCTVITTEATDDVGMIHDRMPLMVTRDRWADWLDPTASGVDVLDLLEPAAPGRLEAFPVSAAVGNVRNNGPELAAPLPLQS
jgi:putative SOS response-associated peptidase YedK